MSVRSVASSSVASAVAGRLAGGAVLSAMAAALPPYRRADLSVDARVADLLGRMTLAEKLDQLHQSGVGDANPHNLAARADELRPTYGAFIVGGPATLFALREALQRRAVEGTRLGIPALFAADVIHGYRTIAPLPLAQACAWDPALVRAGARLAAAEARAQGIDWTFAPMVDHCVDPRWGRIAETFGEAPHAASVFAVAAVEGFQGDAPGAPGSVAACLKHYAGYGASEGGRDYTYTEIAGPTLWRDHLPPFAAGVRAGACTVMSAFNDLNGVPTSAHHFLLTEVLRAQWGFGGVVVSDWNAVLQLVRQGHAADEADAAARALLAGVDLDMADGLYRAHGAALVASGRVPLAAVDAAVARMLRLKFELGLFEQPYAGRTPLTGAAPTPEALAQVEEMAARAMVLLQNDGVLPLAPTVRRIALLGPLAEHRAALLGSWAQQGRPEETETIAEALRARLPAGTTLEAVAGCSVAGDEIGGIAAAVAAARVADAVVLCLGEEPWMSGENASRSSLRLPGRQEELALAVAVAGRPTVVVLVTGRPVEIQMLVPRVGAVLAAWQGGTRAGAAVADLLLGRRAPEGRLAVTWPRATGQVPIHHQLRPRARAGREGAYQDLEDSPLFEFGHGLGYTTFAHGELRLAQPTVRAGETLAAELAVTNTGARAGVETIFWFVRDPAASLTQPGRRLRHFERAVLAPGETRVFRWEISPERDLAFPDADGRPVLEPGEIVLLAGGRSASFQVQP